MSLKSIKSVSLILPVYNEEKIVESAISTVVEILEKNFENYELIIVDDGSKDNSRGIIEDLAKKNPKVRIIYNYINLNQGISVQRALAVAKNEYVLHNGIDLPLDPTIIRTLIDEMEGYDLYILQRNIYSGATLWRKLVSRINILVRRVLFPTLTSGIQDLNFVQIYRNAIIPKVLPLAKSPAFTTPEMYFRARYHGCRIKNKFIDFQARKSGKGSLGKLHDITWSLYDMMRFRYLLWIGLTKHGKLK